MEYNLIQRVKYAKITVYKNYCKLSERKNSMDTLNGVTDYDPFDSFNNASKVHILDLHPKFKNKKTKYFHLENKSETFKVSERTRLDAKGLNGEYDFYTDKDRHIIRHYSNPFSRIKITIWEKSIKIQNDKLYIRFYSYVKEREVNAIYFKKITNSRSFTIDLKSGNFTIGTCGKKSVKFRKNSFKELINFCESRIFNVINLLKSSSMISDKEHGKILKFLGEFDDVEFSNKINKILGFEKCNYSKNPHQFVKNVVKKFVDLKEIKTPNDYEKLLFLYYPGQKFLNKNEKKLVAAILDYFRIKSKVTIKILHKSNNLPLLVKVCYLFGSDFPKYVGSIRDEVFLSNINPSEDFSKEGLLSYKKINFYINNVEKENIVKVINEQFFDSKRKFENFISDLYDHFKMIDKIREYDPTIYMRARTIKEFNQEHTELSKTISTIKKGWSIEYIFDDKMINEIEKPIDVDITLEDDKREKITFYPYILKREEDYAEEGTFMHHCVASYSDKDVSIIISIRNQDGSDRITCEFICQSGICLQSRHFCNGTPPGDMDLALDILKPKVKYFANLGLLHASEKRKVPVMINGVEIKPEIKTAHDLWPEYFMMNPF